MSTLLRTAVMAAFSLAMTLGLASAAQAAPAPAPAAVIQTQAPVQAQAYKAGPQGVPVACYKGTRVTYFWSVENAFAIRVHRWIYGRYSCLNVRY